MSARKLSIASVHDSITREEFWVLMISFRLSAVSTQLKVRVLSCHIVLCFVDWMRRPTDWLTNWPTHWLTDWPIDWLTDCPIDWLTHWLTYPLTDWVTDRLTDWLTSRLTNQLTYRLARKLADQLANWPMEHPINRLTDWPLLLKCSAKIILTIVTYNWEMWLGNLAKSDPAQNLERKIEALRLCNSCVVYEHKTKDV